MTQKPSISQKIEQINALLDRQQFKQAFELLAEVDISQIDSSSKEAGHLFYFTALSLHQKSKFQEALAETKKALDILRNTDENKIIGQTQALLADIYCDTGDLRQAETQCRDALAVFRRIEDNKWVITLYNKLARICYLQSDFERAIEHLRDGIEKAKESNDMLRVAALTLNSGMVYRLLGKWKFAKDANMSALDTARKVGHNLNPMRYLFNLGYIAFLQRRFTEAEDYYKEALELAMEAGELCDSSIYYEYQGELSFVQGDWQKARQLYNKALEIGEKIAPQGDIINQTCRLLAELELSEGNLDEAIDQCNRSLGVSLKLKDRFEEGIAYRILGNIYFAKKDSIKTKENFEKSIKLLKEIKAIYELGRTYLEAGKSNCFNYFERLKFLGNAQDLFSEVGTEYHMKLTEIALTYLSEVSFPDFLTQNPQMLDVIHKAMLVMDKDVTILMQGETGTGKDLLAKLIHYNSNRRDKKFVSINCANLSEALLESELFGHRKGAFTSATVDKKGLLEEANLGTLFLNEIGELPSSIQAKLLAVVENKEYSPIGETCPRKVDARIIAATNKDLEKKVDIGAFREDLYYRLAIIKLNLPPLRERKEDIPLLVEHFLEKHADGTKEKVQAVSNRLSQLFLEYAWPGNIRELENEIIRLAALIEVDDEQGIDRLIQEIQKEKKLKIAQNQSFQETPPQNDSLLEQVGAYERNLILKALEQNNWVIVKTAKALNLPEATLHFKIKKLNLTRS
jgi:transcriptional regulator with PAS, ATPase and Fis domain